MYYTTLESTNIDSGIAELIADTIRKRVEAHSPKNLISKQGTPEEALAVVSPTMFKAIICLGAAMMDKTEVQRRVDDVALYNEITEEILGRKTLIIEEAPEFAIEYFHNIKDVKERYPKWATTHAAKVKSTESTEDAQVDNPY